MQLEISLTSTPIGPVPAARPARTDTGSWVEFAGIVRDAEDGKAIKALEYEAYPAMAIAQMERILTELGGRHPCQFARVIHRVGVIPAGEVAIYVGIASAHRHEGFALLAAFMDRLKQDVPIWKVRSVPA